MQFSAEGGACHDSCHVAWPSGLMPFSNYIIKLDESGVTGVIASSCVQLPEAPSFAVLLHRGILCITP